MCLRGQFFGGNTDPVLSLQVEVRNTSGQLISAQPRLDFHVCAPSAGQTKQLFALVMTSGGGLIVHEDGRVEDGIPEDAPKVKRSPYLELTFKTSGGIAQLMSWTPRRTASLHPDCYSLMNHLASLAYDKMNPGNPKNPENFAQVKLRLKFFKDKSKNVIGILKFLNLLSKN